VADIYYSQQKLVIKFTHDDDNDFFRLAHTRIRFRFGLNMNIDSKFIKR
jgi:hypothetical protein